MDSQLAKKLGLQLLGLQLGLQKDLSSENRQDMLVFVKELSLVELKEH